MKANKLFRKLALSGVALGAAAVTLTATTFAWYTSNTEADVTAVTAQTEAKGSDSLFIATAGAYDTQATGYLGKTWSSFKAIANPTTNGTVTALRPVYSNYSTSEMLLTRASTATTAAVVGVAGRSYNKITGATNTSTAQGWTSTAEYDDEDTADFIEFVIRVKSGKKLAAKTPLYFSEFNITTAAQKDAQDNPISTKQVAMAVGGSTGVDAAGLYGADLMKALKLDISSADVTLNADGTIPSTGTTTRLAGNSGEQNAVSTYGFQSLTDASDTNLTVSSTANAIGYYNEIMDTHFALTGPASDYLAGTEVKTTGTKPLVVAELPASGDDEFSVVEIRFVLYLDGWDNYCYDIMQGQLVNLSFQLSTSSEKSTLFTE